ncbi:hypothetical protein G3R49_04975 [Shewanella sp. WXL01]|uniref:hypothetical protein n=1 Tax=Shewanella sp. WXL01 TaxID=2709721 RepID=UPI0014382DFB|nr:hypothetical protein [Shewanella sp. WXL01]NKF49923.1 hypothetical protein [Shewanella sp. WXL01]
MMYRRATIEDVSQLVALQQSCHIDSLDGQDKSQGFLNTVLSAEQLTHIIETEQTVYVAELGIAELDVAELKADKSKVKELNTSGPYNSELSVTQQRRQIVAMAVCASWQFWQCSATLTQLSGSLVNISHKQGVITPANSYFWGPVCVGEQCRGQGVFAKLYEYSAMEMATNYQFVYTYVHQDNARSLAAHINKAGFSYIKDIEFNGDTFKELINTTSSN